MRLIDADALMMQLEDSYYKRDKQLAVMVGIEYAEDAVKEAPTVGGWVSVKDRVPEESPCEYLVVNNGNVGLAIYLDGLWVAPSRRVNVTHWMPLPEPPKEDEDA